MSKTIWINGTERHIEEKDRYGMYHIFLDDKDIKWLNSLRLIKNTLEEDLIDCFKKRGIEVIGVRVTKGATNYFIIVKR